MLSSRPPLNLEGLGAANDGNHRPIHSPGRFPSEPRLLEGFAME